MFTHYGLCILKYLDMTKKITFVKWKTLVLFGIFFFSCNTKEMINRMSQHGDHWQSNLVTVYQKPCTTSLMHIIMTFHLQV